MNTASSTSLYSPGGQCSYPLASLPQPLYSSVLVLLDGKITLCGGVTCNKCWRYNVRYNEWTELTTSTFFHLRQPAQVYKDQLYYLNINNQSEIYDPTTNVWRHWTPPPVSHGDHTCMVTWRDSFIVLGGYGHPRGVQLYNITTNTWKSLNTMPPIPRILLRCFCRQFDKNEFQLFILKKQLYLHSKLLLLMLPLPQC